LSTFSEWKSGATSPGWPTDKTVDAEEEADEDELSAATA
jgi:hypothetical protein